MESVSQFRPRDAFRGIMQCMHMEGKTVLWGNNTWSEMERKQAYQLKRSILFSLQESCTYSDLVSEKIHCLLHDVKIARQIKRYLKPLN